MRISTLPLYHPLVITAYFHMVRLITLRFSSVNYRLDHPNIVTSLDNVCIFVFTSNKMCCSSVDFFLEHPFAKMGDMHCSYILRKIER